MSTTTDKAVAIKYGQDWDAERGLSYAMEFQLDSLNRGSMVSTHGASLLFLSQHDSPYNCTQLPLMA